MLKSYLKTALRNLKNQWSYSLINVSGLAIGMVCCFLILLFVKDELSYDKYHEKSDRIYRVVVKGRIGNDDLNMVFSCAPMAQAILSDFPEVEQAARLRQRWNEVLVRYEDKIFNESRIYFADSTVFDVFTIPFIQGDPKTALTLSNSVVLTQSIAQKYFGDENPLGKIFTVEGTTEFRVTGVAEDMPHNSHFHFNFLTSLSTSSDSRSTIWLNNNYYTYIVLPENYPQEQLEAKFPDMVLKYVGPQAQAALGISVDEFFASGQSYGYFLQPLTDIHLHSDLDFEMEPNGNILYVYIFSVIAVFIILIACINFMNLATARSGSRAKEVGIRKVVGSYRSQLVRQFLSESVLLSLIAFLLAGILVEVLLPYFNNLSGKQLTSAYFSSWFILPGFFAVALFVGILSGSYPAFFLAAFKPVNVLKGNLKTGMRGSLLRSILVVFQFSISIILFIGTIIIYNQLEYVNSKDLGFDKNNVVVIQRAWALGQQVEAFKNEVVQHTGVINLSVSNSLPGRNLGNSVYQAEGAPSGEIFTLWNFRADYDFLETLRLEMAEGRYYERNMSTDSSSAVVLNESAVAALGLSEPVGKNVIAVAPTPDRNEIYTVIGVVKNFHFESLHQEVRPLAIRILPRGGGSYLSVRVRAEDEAEMLSFLEEKWKSFVPGQPFEYFFLDEQFDSLYRTEQRTGQLVTTLSILAIFIASLGLFGLASFTSEQRTKEIGIRKTFGASVPNITIRLVKEFTKWVVVASVLAGPISYLIMKNWLENFAYRVPIGIWVFLFSAVLAFVIAVITVSYQSIKAAVANPVNSLRYE